MINDNFLSDKIRNVFEKLLIKIIIYELDWHAVIQYFFYLINNEDKYCDIQLISNLSQILLSFFDINDINQTFTYHSNENIKLAEFFQILLSFLNHISLIHKTKFYTPSLSSENEIDNISFLIYKTLQHMKMELLTNEKYRY